jgi:hypothetical protein
MVVRSPKGEGSNDALNRPSHADRVLTWPPADQEKLARFVHAVEQRRAGDDITDEEWKIIEDRAARRDLATDDEVEQVFSRYRSA